MTQYKLIYFNLRGRGEVARLIFTYAGQQFEDYRVKSKEWPQFKTSTLTGKLPILEIKDENNKLTSLVQSRAICRYLANKFNLAGATDLEKAKADEIVDQINDEIDMFGRVHRILVKEEKKKEFERILTQIVPLNLKYFENILSNNSKGFLVGKNLTWADLSLMSKWDGLQKKEMILKEFPLVQKHDENIRNIPQLAEWLKTRPVTPI